MTQDIDDQAVQATRIILRGLDADHSAQDLRCVERVEILGLRLTKIAYESQRFGLVRVEAKERRFFGSPNRFVVTVDDVLNHVRYHSTVYLGF